MDRPPLEVADIFRAYGPDYRQQHMGHLSAVQLRAMRAIEACRTAALGGHLEECDGCGHQRNAYNSCRNRNCPKCQSSAAKRWLLKRESEVLPVPYFHVVFTVPEEIARIALGNQKVVYGILFRCVSQTLLKIGLDPKHLGAQIGFLAILHTWGQNLDYHPHIHCVVAGGGLTSDGGWIVCGKRFFLPVTVLSSLFRGKLLSALNKAFRKGNLRFTGNLSSLSSKSVFGSFLSVPAKKKWVVYCKPPFGGPEQVLQYLGRYTHRIAISNHRLVSLENGKVTFRWKDYRNGGCQKMTLTAQEFIRRFLMHVVPSGFVRIRHYGFLANRNRETSLSLIRSRVATQTAATSSDTVPPNLSETLPNDDSWNRCPVCKQGNMLRVALLFPVKPMDSS
jgi:predicted Zn-ribbon and HTH transcriptional regulator